jgi:hypothetical protein
MNPTPETKPTLAVLAAGIGSRYGGLKQIEPVGPSGELVIDYSIHDAIAAGFGRVVFVIRREIEEAFRSVVEPHFAGRIPISYVYQELTDVPAGFPIPASRVKPWGTAHAVYACRGAIREPFGVINADDFYGPASYGLLAGLLKPLRPADDRYGLVAFVLRNTLSEHGPVARGVCRADADGRLASIAEHYQVQRSGATTTCVFEGKPATLTGDESVSMNLWGLTPTFFGHLEREFGKLLPALQQNPNAEFQLPTVVDTLIRERRAVVEVVKSPERWLGVTYPQDKPAAMAGVRELVSRGVYAPKLWG